MSNLVQGLVWNIDFPGEGKIIALKFADNAHDDGTNVFPSTAHVATKTGKSRSTVCKIRVALEHCGLLNVVGSRDRRSGTIITGGRSRGGTETTVLAFDIELLRRLERRREGGREIPPELMLVEAEIERQATNRDGSPKNNDDGTPRLTKTYVYEIKPYEPAVRSADSSPVRDTDSPPSAGRTAPVRQADGTRPPGGHEPSTKTALQPSLTETARERDAYATLIAELRAEGQPAHVLDAFIVPVLNCVTIGHPQPKGLLGEICKALAEYPDRLLAIAAAHFTTERKKLVSKKDVLDAVKAVYPKAVLKIGREHPGFAAWLAFFTAKGMTGRINLASNQGFVWELTEFPPPGHWQGAALELAGAS